MRARLLSAVLAHGLRALSLVALSALIVAIALASGSGPPDASVLRIDAAEATAAGQSRAQTVPLPDDWAMSRPRFDGNVRYRIAFDRPAAALTDGLIALYIERVCSNLEIDLNHHRIFSGGRMTDPVTVNCRHPQLITLPAALDSSLPTMKECSTTAKNPPLMLIFPSTFAVPLMSTGSPEPMIILCA